ncbi:hypothetical protein BC938DRAFT_478831 [Jimgerdemannia flammicorona]|uniref:AP-4 complex subunit epsilon-1 C-terminal domain-containing protein n=1 Tax=Jimgerdemannia flammicorona TaxID=994334 RepID=A0A433QM72_9FUNG|nr:hypothetical protein BC938DRAFT_478831 [Jimgerdemannia flammicorona]
MTCLHHTTGYIGCSLLLTENHELTIMLVNTLQRDLKSTNYLDICAALNALCQISHPEMVSAVLESVVTLLDYSKEIVRKKSITVLHRFHRLYPQLVSHLEPAFRKALMDKDPSVVAASLNLWKNLVEEDSLRYKDLIPVFIGILQQTIERRLHRSYDYHGVPAPWAQVRCLQVLAALAEEDESASEQIRPVVQETLRRAEKGVDAAFAIILECYCTLARLHPAILDPLFANTGDDASHPFAPLHRFLISHNRNLRYLGLLCLEQVPTRHWVEEWRSGGTLAESLVVGGEDGTVTRKAIRLLDKVASTATIDTIGTRLIQALPLARRDHLLQREMAAWFIGLADKYSAGQAWYLRVMTTTLVEAGRTLEEDEKHVEGGEDGNEIVERVCKGIENVAETETTDLRRDAVDLFYRVLTKMATTVPSALLRLAVWFIMNYLGRVFYTDRHWANTHMFRRRIKRLMSRISYRMYCNRFKACYDFLAVVEDFEFEQMVTTVEDAADRGDTRVEDSHLPRMEQRTSAGLRREGHKRESNGAYSAIKDKGKARGDAQHHQDKIIHQSNIYASAHSLPFPAASGRRHKASEDYGFVDPGQQTSTVLFDGQDYVNQWPRAGGEPALLLAIEPILTDYEHPRQCAPLIATRQYGSQNQIILAEYRKLSLRSVKYFAARYSHTGYQPASGRASFGRSTVPNDGEAMLSSLIALELGDLPLSPAGSPSVYSAGTTSSQQAIHGHHLTTAQFGSLWLKLASHHESKTRVRPIFSGKVDMAAVKDRMEAEVGLLVVEVIGWEFIAAGQIGGKTRRTSETVVLVHTRVSEDGEVEVTTRSKGKEAAEIVVEKVEDVLG